MYGGMGDDRPAVIVKVADADDVVRVIELARSTGLELAVRSGGHSAAGHSIVDGGIVLDVSDMKAIDIDVEDRTVWAESGLTAVELLEALDEHDLAIGFGDTRLGRDRRDHARRRGRLSRPQVRPDHRRPDRRRDRDRRRRRPTRRRRPRPGPVLGDPRRRRELRRRDAVPLPRPRGGPGRRRDAVPAGHGRHRRGVRRGRRGGARGALGDRQRHALPADAVRPGRAPRRARRVRASWSASATPTPRNGRSRRSARWRHRSRTWSIRSRYPEIYPPEDPDYHPSAVGTHDVRRPRRSRGGGA